ncbi:oligosaccharide flippase family protein [Microbulbifer pacificus]|uniref:Oligosaccharide flippase family protein n=1 Tax=Microbulbifer pacificus TaxID=407164 RepID=A0AAU0MVZ1_9GAMM|nr:oligosaccharide flippase family protein [Microbulbifer pacificus]WOX04837.1 oligosaccharide flippase family protein [Microbulbifer pacificus]
MLQKKIISIAGLALVEKAIKLFFLLFLSRLLEPWEFGVVAAASVVVYFADMFANLGFAACLIQLEKISKETVRVALTLTMAVVSLISVCFYWTLPQVSVWVGVPELQSMGGALIVILIARGFSSVSGALLQRDMKASLLMRSSIVSYLVGMLLVAGPMIYSGYGFWSLIYGMVVESLVHTVICYCAARHSIIPLLRKSEIEKLLGKGFGFFITRTINYLALNVDYVIVSKYLGAHFLGLYSRAYRVMEYPSYVYMVAADRVLFPAMAKKQTDQNYLQKTMLKGIFWTFALAAPLSGILAANGENIIRLLLGPTWLEAASVLSILCAFGSYRISYMILNTYVRSVGKVSISSQHSLFLLFAVTVCCYFGVEYGLNGVAWGAGVALLVHGCLYSVRVAIMLNLPWYRFLRIFIIGIPATLAFYLPNYYLLDFLEFHFFLELLVSGILSMVIAVILVELNLLCSPESKFRHFHEFVLQFSESFRLGQKAAK